MIDLWTNLIADCVIKELDQLEQEQAYWKAFIDDIADPWEDKLTLWAMNIFQDTKIEVLDNMKRHPLPIKSVNRITKDPLADWLMDSTTWRQRFRKDIFERQHGIVTDIGQRTMESLPAVDVAFNVENPLVNELLKKRSIKFSASVVDTTEKELRTILAEGIEAGEGMPVLKKRIAQYFEFDRIPKRAEMIARTETIWASGAGTEQAYIQSGQVQGKEWLVAGGERTCFPKNTLVMTKNGQKGIQDIQVGDFVMSHSGWKKVTQVMERSYSGKMIKLKLSNGEKLIATEEHPIYEVNKGWIKAKYLIKGSKLKTIDNETVDIISISNIKFFKAYNFITKFFKSFIPLNIFKRIIVPIISVYFKADIKIRQKKINRKSTDWIFLNKFYLQYFKSFSDSFFNRCFTNILAITRKRTKAPYIFSTWDYSKFFITIKALYNNGWSSTFFRAIFKTPLFIIKRFAASWTNSISNIVMFAFCTTKFPVMCFAFKNNKAFPTNRAFFSNSSSVLHFAASEGIASPRTKFLPPLLNRWMSIKRFPTILTSKNRSFPCGFMVAVARAINLGFVSRNKIFITKFASFVSCLIHNIMNNIFIRCCQPFNVYNLEVEHVHTFYANGILVHNCEMCLEMYRLYGPGTGGVSLGGIFAEEGSEVAGTVVSYEDIAHPPLHPRCRCVLLPVIISR